MRILLRSQYQSVANVVCGHFAVTEKELKSKIRTDRIATVRHIIWYLLHSFGFKNQSQIGEFAGRTHGAVSLGILRCADLVSVDSNFARTVSILESRCKLLLEAK